MPAPASWWESLVSAGIICLCVPAHKQGQINFRPIPIYYCLGDPDSAALVVLMAQLQDNCRLVWHIKNRNFHSTHGNSCPSYALRLIAKPILPSLHILSMLLFQARVLENILMGPKPQNHFFHVYYAALIEEKHLYLLFSCTNSLIPFPLRARLNIFPKSNTQWKGVPEASGFHKQQPGEQKSISMLRAKSRCSGERGTSCLWMAAAQAGTVVPMWASPSTLPPPCSSRFGVFQREKSSPRLPALPGQYVWQHSRAGIATSPCSSPLVHVQRRLRDLNSSLPTSGCFKPARRLLLLPALCSFSFCLFGVCLFSFPAPVSCHSLPPSPFFLIAFVMFSPREKNEPSRHENPYVYWIK